jgi:hypothetical protein
MSEALQNWNFLEKRLAHRIGETGGEFVTSESVLLLVTPIAQYVPEALDRAKTVALTQDIGLSQARQSIQVFEVGSNLKYTIASGRTQAQMNISRVLFDGENLLKALSPSVAASYVDRDHPGYGKFLSNLSSSLFMRPVGVALIFRDLQNHNVGGIFLEETFIQAHQMQISANSPFLGENVQLIFNAILPMRVSLAGLGAS